MPITLCGDDMVRAFRLQEVTMLQNKSRLQKQLVVAVTANGAEFKDLLGVGFDDVYPKPVTRKTLLSVVADYLDNEWHDSMIWSFLFLSLMIFKIVSLYITMALSQIVTLGRCFLKTDLRCAAS